MIKFNCTGCGVGYSVPQEYGGKRVKCKKCERTNSIPKLSRIQGIDTQPVVDDFTVFEKLLSHERNAPVFEE